MAFRGLATPITTTTTTTTTTTKAAAMTTPLPPTTATTKFPAPYNNTKREWLDVQQFLDKQQAP